MDSEDSVREWFISKQVRKVADLEMENKRLIVENERLKEDNRKLTEQLRLWENTVHGEDNDGDQD